MDRVIVYDGALPQTTDVLNAGKFNMIAEAYQNLAILGNGTLVAGLACNPTSPASLQVTVGPGSIFQLDPTDQTAYGDLGVDNNSLMKQALLQSTVSLTITPPGTVGFSQVYLVQAILNDVDTGNLVLSYYNSANPAVPFSGPANAGSSNFTVRSCQCIIALKAGVPATTGSQVTPTPDAGYTALYTITVANGALTITSGNISQVSTAPFFPTLPSIPSHIQRGDYLWGTDTGVANAYVLTIAPIIQPLNAYVAGMTVRFKAVNANSGAGGSTINVNGLGTVAIKRAGGATLAAGDIVSGQVLELTYDGAAFQMANYLGISAGSTTNNFNTFSMPYIADTSVVANQFVANYSPAITSGQQVAGLFIAIKVANNVTGATTINVNGLGTKAVTLGNLGALSSSAGIVSGEILILAYDGTEYQVVSSLGSGAGGGTIGPTGPAGPTGPQGATGAQGTIPLTPGGIGSYAFAYVDGGYPGSQVWVATSPYGFQPGGFAGPYGWTANTVYTTGTWQVVSTLLGILFVNGAGYIGFSLVQRIA